MHTHKHQQKIAGANICEMAHFHDKYCKSCYKQTMVMCNMIIHLVYHMLKVARKNDILAVLFVDAHYVFSIYIRDKATFYV